MCTTWGTMTMRQGVAIMKKFRGGINELKTRKEKVKAVEVLRAYIHEQLMLEAEKETEDEATGLDIHHKTLLEVALKWAMNEYTAQESTKKEMENYLNRFLFACYQNVRISWVVSDDLLPPSGKHRTKVWKHQYQ